jgi:hypothetical protein
VLGQRQDAVELATDAPLRATDGAHVQPGAQAGARSASQAQAVPRGSGQLVDRDREIRHQQRPVEAEPRLEVLDVDEVEAAGGEQTGGCVPRRA